ncbi:hypothetical protein [Nocardia sp. IFM 10818]
MTDNEKAEAVAAKVWEHVTKINKVIKEIEYLKTQVTGPVDWTNLDHAVTSLGMNLARADELLPDVPA